jgi:peptidoglycan hydrolase CwlO-like protein
MMGLASKEKVTFSVIGLGIVVVIMALLAAVYYTNATNVQNHANVEIANLQAENANLQQQINSLNSQVTGLNTQLSDRNNQIASLNAQNNELSNKVDYWTGLAEAFASQVAEMRTPNTPTYTQGMGSGSHSRN